MKKILILFFLISTISFTMSNQYEESLFKNNNEDKIIGEFYSATFDNETEKSVKMKREKKYLMEKDDFQYFFDKNGKDGVAYKASYKTPSDYTVSFKAFCGNKYISVYGNYIYFDELLKVFMDKTKSLGYEF